MHRLSAKAGIPDCLAAFCNANPTCREWKHFYENFHDSYEELKKAIAAHQGYLCAYCEEKLPCQEPSQMRVEHFHPKEDVSSEHNWAFDWCNMLVTCHGGSRDCLTTERHCDQSKEQHVDKDRCEGYLLNPLTMPSRCLFSIEQATGELKPDEEACKAVAIPENHYDSVLDLVIETIRILNLNCDRLKENRLKVIREFERKRKSKRRNPKMNQSSIRTAIASEWFEGKIPSYYTTRRILLGKYAEAIIAAK